MNKRTLIKTSTIMTAAILSLAVTAQAKVATGSNVSDISVVDTQGQFHNLSDYAGKKVVLEWTNHGCPYVKKHYNTDYDGGNMQNLQRAAAEDGVVWLSIISSAPGKQGYISGAEAEQMNKDRGATPMAVLLDATGEAGRIFSAKTTPHMYVIDENQTLVYQGAIDSNRSSSPATIAGATNYVTEALTALNMGLPIEKPETSPYGCSVKY